jgi:hypothetical protein
MSDEQLRQHQKLARGEDIMSEYSCESPFKNGVSHGSDGVSRKRALKDGSRSHDGTTRHPDHGPHDMGVPNPRTD